jgi:acetyl esterase/lipase
MLRKVLAASTLCFATSLAAAPEAPVPLWPGVAPGSGDAAQTEVVETDAEGSRAISHIGTPALVPFYAASANGTAIIVSPGGGLKVEMFDKEGVEIARWLNSLGVDAYVLKYRLPSEGHSKGEDVPLQDIQRAIRLVRAQQAHTARRIGTMGFSAGGHLTSLSAVYYGTPVYAAVDSADTLSARPDFFAVIYGFEPRPDDPELAHFPSDSPAYKYLTKYPFEPAVTADTPPAFVIHGDADRHVSAEHGGGRIEAALAKAGVPCEFHLIKGADHGFALRGIGEDKKWPGLFAAWLERLK